MRAPRLSIGLGSFLVALALVVAVGIGSAIAVIPDNGTYSACLTKATGEIRVVNYPKVKCAKGERLIRWSQEGPAGPVGAQGPQGPAGPADWNAIPNIPGGFADGVDDIGPSYTSQIKWTVNAMAGAGGYVDVQYPASVDVLASLIPIDACTWDFAQTGVGRSGSDVYQRWAVKNTAAVSCSSRVRVVIFGDGITPASLKRALKKIKVTVAGKKAGIRVETR